MGIERMMRVTLPCDTSKLKASVPQNLSSEARKLRGTLNTLGPAPSAVFFFDTNCRIVMVLRGCGPGSEVLERVYGVSRRP